MEKSTQIGTITAYVDSKEVEIGHLVVTTEWVRSDNYGDMLTRCMIHNGFVGAKIDDLAVKRNITKIKLQLLWFAVKNLFTK